MTEVGRLNSNTVSILTSVVHVWLSVGSKLSDSTGKHTQTQIQAKPLDLTVAWKELEDLPEILSAADLDKWQG